MPINTVPAFNFQFAKYEPDPKTLCCLCKESCAPSHLITVPEDKNICIKCAELLGEIAAENREKIKVSEIEKMLAIESEMPDSYQPYDLMTALYDAGYRKME